MSAPSPGKVRRAVVVRLHPCGCRACLADVSALRRATRRLGVRLVIADARRRKEFS